MKSIRVPTNMEVILCYLVGPIVFPGSLILTATLASNFGDDIAGVSLLLGYSMILFIALVVVIVHATKKSRRDYKTEDSF